MFSSSRSRTSYRSWQQQVYSCRISSSGWARSGTITVPAPAAEEKAAPDKGKEKEKAKPAKTKAARKKAAQPEPAEPPAPKEDPELTAMRSAIRALVAEQSDEDGWLAVSMIGNLLVKRYPDFDVRNFGSKSLNKFLTSLAELEVEERILANGNPIQFVRIRPLPKKTAARRPGAKKTPRRSTGKRK